MSKDLHGVIVRVYDRGLVHILKVRLIRIPFDYKKQVQCTGEVRILMCEETKRTMRGNRVEKFVQLGVKLGYHLLGVLGIGA